MARSQDAFCSLDDVIVAPAVATVREAAQTQVVEAEAFLELSRALADAPASALQCFLDHAMRGTAAESAGISVEESDAEGVFFRWIATAGEFSRYVNGTMPRDFSPCGATVDGARPLVMRSPERYYTYASQFHAPVRTVMLVPYRRGGKAVGTVWVAMHSQDRVFTRAELRFVENLGNFASDVLDSAGH